MTGGAARRGGLAAKRASTASERQSATTAGRLKFGWSAHAEQVRQRVGSGRAGCRSTQPSANTEAVGFGLDLWCLKPAAARLGVAMPEDQSSGDWVELQRVGVGAAVREDVAALTLERNALHPTWQIHESKLAGMHRRAGGWDKYSCVGSGQ